MTAVPELSDVLAAYRSHVSRGRAQLADLIGSPLEVTSFGSRVFDHTGRQFLDCGGYAVFIHGHCHPRIVAAVVEQIQRHPMATRLLLEPTVALAAQAVAEVAPKGLRYVHFVNSGAEATEAAVKLARANGKRHLVSAVGGYHGKTTGALSLTAHEFYQTPFRPLLPGVTHVPYADLPALAAVLERTPDCCVVLEPVQGEAGVIIPPPGYLRGAAELCREHGAFLVLDEIQTGLGRLGTWWGADREGICPDILLAGKNLSGGVIPVAAMIATEQAYAPFSADPYLHTSTFAGSPVAAAAALAAVEVLREERLVTAANRWGVTILDALRPVLHEVLPHLLVEVRGVGLLIGIELVDEHAAGELVIALLDAGVIVNHSLNAHRVIRLTPPAVFTDQDLSWLVGSFTRAARAVARQRPHSRRSA